MTEWEKEDGKETRSADGDLGGTMRLGAYPCVLEEGTLARKVYGEETISERHRHRFEVNMSYRELLEEKGLKFSGVSPDGRLPEIVEVPRSPLVHRGSVPPRTKIQTLRSSSLVQVLRRGRGNSEPVGLILWFDLLSNALGQRRCTRCVGISPSWMPLRFMIWAWPVNVVGQ